MRPSESQKSPMKQTAGYNLISSGNPAMAGRLVTMNIPPAKNETYHQPECTRDGDNLAILCTVCSTPRPSRLRLVRRGLGW